MAALGGTGRRAARTWPCGLDRSAQVATCPAPSPAPYGTRPAPPQTAADRLGEGLTVAHSACESPSGAGLSEMGREGLEPTTMGLKVPCSTN